MTSTDSAVRALMDRRSEGIHARDIDRLMSCFSPDVVYFDLVPPLRYSGYAALRDRFLDWFGRWETSIGQELRDLTVLASGDVAAAHMLIRTSGTLKSGNDVGYWVRTTDSCQRSNDGWVITHEHFSLPVALPSGSAAMDLVP
jgi:ketosteroid isomerase-like protein